MFFILLQKLFLFLRKSKFKILDIQISWYHPMPKHKTRKTIYWITWKVDTVCQWNLASLCHIPKGKFVSKNYIKTAIWNIVPRPFVFAKNYAQPLLENEIFEATCLYYICNSKNIKICQNHHAHLLRFLFTGDSLKIKRAWN